MLDTAKMIRDGSPLMKWLTHPGDLCLVPVQLSEMIGLVAHISRIFPGIFMPFIERIGGYLSDVCPEKVAQEYIEPV